MVMERLRRESWWVRSRRASEWPCAGNGNIKMCVDCLFFGVDIVLEGDKNLDRLVKKKDNRCVIFLIVEEKNFMIFNVSFIQFTNLDSAKDLKAKTDK